MNEQNQSFAHTNGVLSDYFMVESHVLSTRSADAYKAIDRGGAGPVLLWILRHPLAVNSDAVKRFLSRMRAICAIEPAIADVLSFGVDSEGMAFSVFPALDGYSIISGNLELSESERRFTAMLRFIEKLHRSNLVCGDLSHSSFWVSRDGDLKFVGIMGSFDSEAVDTAALPPQETLHYLAPEQRMGAGVEPASDVFALGVLGYRLITGQYPFADDGLDSRGLDIKKVAPISSLVNVPPVWAEEVIMRCLVSDPQKRYADAGAVLAAIAASRERVMAQAAMPVPKSKQNLLAKSPSMQTHKQYDGTTPAIKPDTQVGQVRKRKFNVFPIVAFLILGVSLVFAFLSGKKEEEDQRKLQEKIEEHKNVAASPELEQAIERVAKPNLPSKEKMSEIETMVNNDDPLAHQVLVDIAINAGNQSLKEYAEKGIIDRARRLGMLRSSEQVRQWLRSIKAEERPPSYAPILKSLDKTLPMEARNSALIEAYATNPRVTLKLAGALALDTDQSDDFQGVMAKLVGDNLRMDNASDYSALALIMTHPELGLIYSDDAAQRIERLTDRDIPWVMQVLADKDDINVRVVANLAINRKAVSRLRTHFLELVRDRENLAHDVRLSLIKAAIGKLVKDDITSFGRWDDRDAEVVLLALCADAPSSEILGEAFDILAGKSVAIEPSASMINWVRKNYWEERLKLARPIGVLGSLDLVEPEAISQALADLKPYFKDRQFFKILLDTKNANVQKVLVEKHAELLGLGLLLNLLSSPDKDTRIATIKALKPYNDLGALKIIIERYQKEKDPEVKQVFRDNFWVIKERGY